jgi:hypothetical protein
MQKLAASSIADLVCTAEKADIALPQVRCTMKLIIVINTIKYSSTALL